MNKIITIILLNLCFSSIVGNWETESDRPSYLFFQFKTSANESNSYTLYKYYNNKSNPDSEEKRNKLKIKDSGSWVDFKGEIFLFSDNSNTSLSMITFKSNDIFTFNERGGYVFRRVTDGN